MGHFIEMERRYLNGDMSEPESDSFLEPEKITPSKCLPVSEGVHILLIEKTLGIIIILFIIKNIYIQV